MASDMASGSSSGGGLVVDHSTLPAVREAQGGLMQAIFAHQAFDSEGDRMYGKLFYVFEETVAVNDALELAHLGDDADSSVRAALARSIDTNELVVGEGNSDDGDAAAVPPLLARARDRYKDKIASPGDIEDVDLGDELRTRAAAVRDAARRVLGQ